MDLDALPAKRRRREVNYASSEAATAVAAAAAAAPEPVQIRDGVSIGYAAASMMSFHRLLVFLQHDERGQVQTRTNDRMCKLTAPFRPTTVRRLLPFIACCTFQKYILLTVLYAVVLRVVLMVVPLLCSTSITATVFTEPVPGCRQWRGPVCAACKVKPESAIQCGHRIC
jgi:hypothetical protein